MQTNLLKKILDAQQKYILNLPQEIMRLDTYKKIDIWMDREVWTF